MFNLDEIHERVFRSEVNINERFNPTLGGASKPSAATFFSPEASHTRQVSDKYFHIVVSCCVYHYDLRSSNS